MERVELTKKGIYLGRTGEEGTRKVWKDVTAWAEEYGEGTGLMLYTNPEGKVFPMGTETEETEDERKLLVSPVTAAETAVDGAGVIEVRWLSAGVMVKSDSYNTLVLRSAYDGRQVGKESPRWVRDLMVELNAAGVLLDRVANVAADVTEQVRDAEAWAKGTRGGVPVESGDDQYQNSAAYYADLAEGYYEDAADEVENAEAWATGTRDGAPIDSGDPAYGISAKDYAETAEAYGAGTRGGDPLEEDDPAYANSAPHFADAANEYRIAAEAWAVGTQDGTPVSSGDSRYHNNAKYYSEQAESAAEAAMSATPTGYDNLVGSVCKAYSATATYPVGYYVLHNGALYKCVTAVTTAASWETNADNFEAVSAAEETEGLYLGEALTKRGTLNLLDGVYWSSGSLGSANPVPVEYGKKYTASFSAYANRVIALDENENELGDTSTDTYIKRTEVFSVWRKKWVYEIMNQSVKYIRFKQMSQPAAPYFLVEGDIDMPYPLDVSTLTAVDANRDDLRKVIFEDEKVGFDDLRADISEGVKKLGYTDKVIESGDVQEYNAETYPLTFDDAGNVVMADASALRSGTYVMLLKANVNGLYIDKFGYNIDSGAPSGGIAGPPAIVMQTNVGHTGYVLTFRTYGSKIAGISYIYSWNTNGTFQAADSSYAWASEYAIDTLRVKRNSDSFDFIFKDTQGTVTTKHFTFAQMHVTDPDALGLAWIDKKTSAVDNQMVIAGMKVSAPGSITGGGTVTSPMNGAKYDAWGDSYTEGSGTYANIIAEQTGAVLTNYGVSGNTVAQMYARMQAATVDGAYVSVLCGVNDYLHDTVMATFRASVANVCAFIAASYTSAKALWVLPPQLPDNSANTEGNTLEDYVDAIREICAANSVPVLDMYHAGNWYGTVAAFEALYFQDGVHPNTAGHNLLAGKVRKALEAL